MKEAPDQSAANRYFALRFARFQLMRVDLWFKSFRPAPVAGR